MVEIGLWQIAGLVAGSSVIAAILNQGFSAISTLVARRRDRDFGRLYLALSLEEYASQCSDTISSSEVYDASDRMAGAPQTNLPPLPPYPDNVDWKALGLSATNHLLSFRVQVDSIRAQIRDSLEHDVEGAVEDTRTYSADIGLKAMEIAAELRADAGAPRPPLDLEWSTQEYLESKRDEYRKPKHTLFAPPAEDVVVEDRVTTTETTNKAPR